MNIRGAAAGFVLACAVVIPAHEALALDLPAVLAQVAEQNPSLAARAALVDAAGQRVHTASVWTGPELMLGFENVPTSPLALNRDPMTMTTIELRQRIPIAPGRGLRKDAAAENVNAARSELTLARWQRWGDAWAAYADAFYANELAIETAHHHGVMDRIVAAARAQYQSGRGRLDAVLRAETERARIIADEAIYRGEEQVARARLNALRGITAAAGETLAAVPMPTVASVEPFLNTTGHPQLAAAEARQRSYQQTARASRRTRWPDLDLRVMYGFRDQVPVTSTTVHPGGHTVTDYGTEKLDDMVSASIGFMVPLPNGRGSAESDEWEAMARASEAERREASFALEQDIRSAHTTALATERLAGILADTVLVAGRRAVDAAWVSYEAGTIDLWQVLEASHALYEQEVALANARRDLAHAHARLVALTGRTELLGVSVPDATEEPR
jgi:outer membrane protein TolC